MAATARKKRRLRKFKGLGPPFSARGRGEARRSNRHAAKLCRRSRAGLEEKGKRGHLPTGAWESGWQKSGANMRRECRQIGTGQAYKARATSINVEIKWLLIGKNKRGEFFKRRGYVPNLLKVGASERHSHRAGKRISNRLRQGMRARPAALQRSLRLGGQSEQIH